MINKDIALPFEQNVVLKIDKFGVDLVNNSLHSQVEHSQYVISTVYK